MATDIQPYTGSPADPSPPAKAGGRRLARRRAVRWVTLAAVLCLVAVGDRRAMGQASVNEMFQAISVMMNQGAFTDAIPAIQQLITWLGDSRDDDVRLRMQSIFFNLGIAHFFLGEFDPAQRAFEDYKRRYPRSARERLATADQYIADCLRFKGLLPEALQAYETALRTHRYPAATQADIFSAIARCHLAQDNWEAAMDPLLRVLETSWDFVQHNWAATLLVTAYLKNLELDKVYPLVPMLLQRDSLASRSVAFNMAALEAGDELFSTERYREAVWVHRLVYSHDMVTVRSEEYLQSLRQEAERLRESGGDARTLMRLQESIGELEEEIKAMAQIDNYDAELSFRVARGYMELSRFWEARELFLHLHRVSGAELAEEALFLAFRCSAVLLPWSRAYAIGETYMQRYPSGEWFPMVTLAMGQMYAREQNWPMVIEHLTRTLEMSPEHPSAAECLFLIGYARFMEEQFPEAVATFRQMNRDYPENEMLADATYWTGMALLFDRKYGEAEPEFAKVLDVFPDSIYFEDAMFRRAVCRYGQGMMDEADVALAAFIDRFPEAATHSEAVMMRGDIAGATGRLADAVAYYQAAMVFDNLHIEHYNHCAFQAAQILHDEEEYDALRAHFLRYLEHDREGANHPQAIYWIGVALWNMGEQAGALDYYQSAVAEYGQDPGAIGVDLILDEWVGRSKRGGQDLERAAWLSLRTALREAQGKGQRPLVLRLSRVMLYNPRLTADDRNHLQDELLRPQHLEHASPAVARAMLETALARGLRDRARAIAEHVVATFTETDYALDARMTLATLALEDAKQAPGPNQRDAAYAEALRHLNLIRSVYAATPEAAQALLMLGWMYLDMNDARAADEAFTAVLGHREWRSSWPEALYGRGESFFARRQFLEATAYYERIYLMYSHYRAWTAKAYLRRAECLRRLLQYQKALEVLDEMLADTELAAMPEGLEARKMRENLRR